MSPAEALSREEFARMLGIHPRTADRWRKRGICGLRLPATRVGTRYRFHMKTYEAWQQQLEERIAPPVPLEKRTARQEQQAREQTDRDLRRLGVRLPEDRA